MYRKHILVFLIGVISLLIVICLAVAISVVRSNLLLDSKNNIESSESAVDTLDDVDASQEADALILKRMQQMHEKGNASTTSEQLQRMEQMNEQTPDLTEEEQAALLERMRAMQNAS
jgi:hypothetical protein